jgi:hypothetical protein
MRDPKDPERWNAKFETTTKTGKAKSRRVSQRRELAVVTLGMVASIAGLGGPLAADPPSAAQETVQASAEALSNTAAPVDSSVPVQETSVKVPTETPS